MKTFSKISQILRIEECLMFNEFSDISTSICSINEDIGKLVRENPDNSSIEQACYSLALAIKVIKKAQKELENNNMAIEIGEG